MYDFAHGQSDSIEGVTHSICTLEFIPHRELYNWLIEKLEIFPSQQYEFARLNMTYTVMSKRKLLQLVNEKHVDSWDDPRMPTISGMRRRGYTAKAIRDFCDRIGVAKRENMIDLGLLEFFVREDLNKTAQRRMAVLDPVKLIITNYEEGHYELLPTENNPEMPEAGERMLHFGNELWIEREDFMEESSRKWFRLAPGTVVRLKSAYIVRCTGYEKGEDGRLRNVLAEYIPESKSGSDTSGVHAKGTIHWISAPHAVTAEVRLYDRLFKVEDPSSEEGDFKSYLNPDSLQVIKKAYIEPDLLAAKPGTQYQFLRKGYFVLDSLLSSSDRLVFNRTVTLKDAWAKVVKKG
jgi:glutaminyl-tRNA synthetase